MNWKIRFSLYAVWLQAVSFLMALALGKPVLFVLSCYILFAVSAWLYRDMRDTEVWQRLQIRQPYRITVKEDRKLTINPGWYWFGIKLHGDYSYVEVLPGRYILPFATTLVYLRAGCIDYLKFSGNYKLYMWNKKSWYWTFGLCPIGTEEQGEVK